MPPRRPGWRRLALTLGIAALGLAAIQGSAQAAVGAGGNAAQAAVVPQGEVTLSDLPEATETELHRMILPPRPRNGLSDADYAKLKARAGASVATQAGGKVAPPPAGADRQTPGTTLAFAGQRENGSAPSDMALAVGTTYVVQVINTAIAVYTKGGSLHSGFPKSLSAFFPGTSGDLGDPRAFYDWNAGRFVVEADDFTRGRVWIAASKTSDPTGAWNTYSFAPWGAANCRASGSACPDFPQLGFSDGTIMLGINYFPAAGGISDWMLLLPKTAIYAGQGFSYNLWSNLTWNGVRVDSVQPATLYSPSEHPRVAFAVNSFNISFGGGQCRNGCNGLVTWAFSNNLISSGSPGAELSAAGIGTATTYRLPAGASEPGCSGCVDTGDTRISATPVLHAGLISASLNTNGPDGHSHAMWFQLRPFLNDNDARCTGAFLNKCAQITSVQLVNEDCYLCGGEGAGGSTYYGALAPDDAGDLTMVFAYSDNNIYPGGAYVSRRVTQAQNTMHDSGIFLCSGAGAVRGRWGDYFAAAGDLTTPNQDYMWFSSDNAQSSGAWATCIGRNGFLNGAP